MENEAQILELWEGFWLSEWSDVWQMWRKTSKSGFWRILRYIQYRHTHMFLSQAFNRDAMIYWLQQLQLRRWHHGHVAASAQAGEDAHMEGWQEYWNGKGETRHATPWCCNQRTLFLRWRVTGLELEFDRNMTLLMLWYVVYHNWTITGLVWTGGMAAWGRSD